jgi:hypothetical protein
MKQAIGSYLAILAFGSISQIALAEDFTPAMQVLGMEVGDTNALYLRMSGETKCGSPLAVVGKAQPYYKDMLKMALVAYSAGKDIRVLISSCDVQKRAVIVRMVLGTV